MPERNQHDAAWYVSRGYRRVSCKYRMVARIDREDWREYLANRLQRTVAELCLVGKAGGGWQVGSDVTSMWRDHYRRCYSKDTIEGLHSDVFRQIPSSSYDECGYVPLPEGEST
jgi:hypothetical protein